MKSEVSVHFADANTAESLNPHHKVVLILLLIAVADNRGRDAPRRLAKIGLGNFCNSPKLCAAGQRSLQPSSTTFQSLSTGPQPCQDASCDSCSGPLCNCPLSTPGQTDQAAALAVRFHFSLLLSAQLIYADQHIVDIH
jgi:hypothetical protein